MSRICGVINVDIRDNTKDKKQALRNFVGLVFCAILMDA